MTLVQRDRYCIVGAGPSGLCAARWLGELGVAFDVLERQRDVGGIWDISAPGSPMYESCHFISSRTLSGFASDPMPDAYPDYPRHDLVLEYLRRYADRHDLRPHIEFGTSVEHAIPTADGWCVSLGSGETRSYAGLIASVGNEWRASRPDIPGTFEGSVIHSSEYTSPESLRGKRVLVVGGGNSGCDIAVDAATHARSAAISLRRGYHFVPKHIFGKPADVFAASSPNLPAWIEQPVFEKLLRLLLGDLRRYGLPAPDHRIFETHPILNTRILECLAHGDISVHGDVASFDGRAVHFRDGHLFDRPGLEFDLVILATGYVRGVPFLDDDVLPDDDVSVLLSNVFHERLENLFVVGHFTTEAGAFPVIDKQCELLARVIEAQKSAPERARRFFAREREHRPRFSNGVRYKRVTRMANYVASVPYKRYLGKRIAALSR